MELNEIKQLNHGSVILVNQFGTEEVATFQGFGQDGKIFYNFISGGGSVGSTSHVVEVLDNKHWKESDVFYKVYKDYWGFEYPRRKAL